TFGTNGVVTTDFGGADQGQAVALQSDGKIVVAGNSAGNKYVLARYDARGVLDPSFGSSGKVTTASFGTGARAVAVQTDGKIVVAGIATGPVDNTPDFGVIRYNTDGSLDTGFGSG